MTDKFQQLEANLNALVGQACWSVLISGGLDNGLTLSLGDKIARSVPLNSPNLTPHQQQFAGAFELSIMDCTWRMDSPDDIITSWSDDAEIQGQHLKHLLDTSVRAWEITWPGLDLTLHFANALSLRLFCDQTDPIDSGENYALLTPELLFSVGIRSALTVTIR